MAGIRYLGSKARIAHQIMDIIPTNNSVFYDLFCGTVALGELALEKGFSVICNDYVAFACVDPIGYISYLDSRP